MAHQKEVQVDTDHYICESWGICRLPEHWLGKYLRAEMHYEAASRSHILPKSCSKVKSDASLQVSQDLLDGDPAYALTTKLNATSLLCEQIRLQAVWVIIFDSIFSGLTSQGMPTSNPRWKGRFPKDHPSHGSSSGSSFSVKKTRKGQVLQQEPVLRETHRKSMGRVL